jgi:hypothetical protein
MSEILYESQSTVPAGVLSLDIESAQRAEKFPFDAVRVRYMKDANVSEEIAREHERELKRYLLLCARNATANYGMKGPVDDLWHTFLLFTIDYAAFCESVAGRFIHHVPASAVRPVALSEYDRFLVDYETAFGEPAPAHIWPRLPDGTVSADSADCSFGNCGPSCTPSCGASGCKASE